jgi:SAM-dependent methyltransferase
MDYDKTFEKRGSAYKYAIETYPHVLENEFKTAIEMCKVKSSDIILNIPAACIPLNKYFTVKPHKYIEYETNDNFATLLSVKTCKLNKIPEIDNSIDTVISLASLHHTNNTEREEFYSECYRVLKSDTGKLIIGDVIENSKESIWLNVFVNKYNSLGHKGNFWKESDKNILELKGYSVNMKYTEYTWNFNSENELVDFCKNLFGLDLASAEEILLGINTILDPETINGKIYVRWNLIYFIAIKAPIFLQFQADTVDSPQQE